MSIWTHIVSTIDIETYIEDKNIKEKVQEILKNAPEISGSEGSADVFVNELSGHNVYISCDCNSCEYKNSIVHRKEGGFSCDADMDYKCPCGKYQTRVVITIIGDLRDREKKTTIREYGKFISFLINKCDFDIRNRSENIIQD